MILLRCDCGKIFKTSEEALNKYHDQYLIPSCAACSVASQESALRELTAMSQELGFYDL